MRFEKLEEGQYFTCSEFGVCQKENTPGYGNAACLTTGHPAFVTVASDTEVNPMSDMDVFRWDNGAF